MDRLQEYHDLRQSIENHHYDWMLEIQSYEEASAKAKELGTELDSRRESVALINADLRMMVEGKNEGERQADLTRRQSADPDHQEARSAELEVQADLDATRLVIGHRSAARIARPLHAQGANGAARRAGDAARCHC